MENWGSDPLGSGSYSGSHIFEQFCTPCPLFRRNVALTVRGPKNEGELYGEGESGYIVRAAVGRDHHVFADLMNLDEYF
jgi:hypothetical protein